MPACPVHVEKLRNQIAIATTAPSRTPTRAYAVGSPWAGKSASRNWSGVAVAASGSFS